MFSIFFFIVVVVSSSSTVPLNDFFPFGPQAGDTTMRPSFNGSEGPFRLPYVFPYFDNNYRQIWIANNGLFSFLPPINHFFPDSFPLDNDSCLVAGFWYQNIRSAVNDTGNKVYYQIHSTTSPSNSSLTVLNKASDYVRNFFPQQRPFKPTMAITGTWYYVGLETNATSRLNNTFQIVISTDEDRSFVFFLYHDLQWAESYNNTGYYAQAGFHAGDRNISETLPNSGSEDIVKLVNQSNVNVPGLFAFRVDADKINAGGCNDSISMVSFRPRISSQLGSTALSIYGPCFKNQTRVKCRFGSSPQTINGFVVDEFRATCLTPFASKHGSVQVNISIDNGQTFISAGTFTYAPLQFGSDEVTIETEDVGNLLVVGKFLNLTWDFSEIVRNTFPTGTKINIELWKVSLSQQSQLQQDNHSVILGQNLVLTNYARIQLPESISDISTCFIRVVAHFNSQIYAGLNTGLLIVKSHPSLAPELCQKWAAQQPEPSTWNSDDLLPCPMTHWQALAAGRCCYEYDRQCYKGSTNPKNCWLHQARSGREEPSAVECYISRGSNRNGAGAECCYDNNETLITRGTGAGTDDRYQPVTSPVQHFFDDTLPYLQCCLMSTNTEACNKYMHYRPPRRGSNTMGENGRMWGDPHFGTLDGTSYTFNGYGEYTYLFISNKSSPSAAFNSTDQSYIFTSQIRTVPLLPSNVTVTKGFAARSNDAGAKRVSLTVSRREQLILRRGDEALEFEDNIDTFFFPELTISRLDGNINSLFSLSWTIGVTIQVSLVKITSPSKQLVLNVAASVAGIYRGKTYGLLGTYDGVPNNDLRSKSGIFINSSESLEQIHNRFGITWAIDPSNSLFYYESDQSAEFFQQKNLNFTPSFVDPMTSTAINSSIRATCNINATSLPSVWNLAQRACYYDLSKTGDISFAQTSLNAGNEFLLIKANQRNLPLFNSSLPLNMDLKHGEPVHLNISASSEVRSNAVVISVLHIPQNAQFNNKTNVFNWTAVEGEHYLSVQAHDTKDDLKSKHDITFNVKAAVNGGTHRFNEASSIVLVVSMIVFLCQ